MQQVNAPGVRWEWISEAWNLFTKQWSAWVLMILVAGLICFVVEMIIYVPFFGMIMASSIPQDGDIPTAPVFPAGLLILYPVIFLAIATVMSWLMGGLYSAAFKQVRGEQIAVGDLFSGGRYFVRILGALLLVLIAFYIGFFLFVIPGLIVYGFVFLTFPMIVEGGKGSIDAIKASIEVVKRDWIMFTLFAVALYLIAIAGVFACGIGALATMPLLFLGHALIYRDLVGIPGAQSQGQFMQPPPPPDYRDYAPAQTPAQPQAPAWAPPPNYGSTPAPEPAAKTCPHCGATLARAVNFCNQCGRPLRGA
jgi:hypothetical protein